MRIFPGVEKALDGLRARGASLGIVTSKRPESYARDFVPFALDGYFDLRITCADTLLHKPHPEPLLKFLERAGVGPSEALYVGDSVYDRDCARAAGVDFALAVWGSARPEMENVTWRLNAPEDLLAISIHKKRGESSMLFPRSSFWRYSSVVCASGAFCALFWWWV